VKGVEAMVGGVEMWIVQQCLRRFCDAHLTWIHAAINRRNTFVPTWILSVVRTFYGRCLVLSCGGKSVTYDIPLPSEPLLS